jgi:hypothetical protein
MPTPIFTLKRCETTFGIRGEALSAPLAQVEALALPALPHTVNPEISIRRGEAFALPHPINPEISIRRGEAFALPHPVNPEISVRSVSTTSTTTGTADGTTNTLPVYLSKN